MSDGKKNPWFSVPAKDYENHMGSPEVGQLQFLNDVFRKVLYDFRPRRIAVIGCTTGNGFEHIDFSSINKIVAIDINPEYIKVLRDRFSKNLSKIETICADINECDFNAGSFDLIHCALMFEYLDPSCLLKNINKWLVKKGIMSVVLQVADENLKAVTDTPYKSIKNLESIIRLVKPDVFDSIARSHGFTVVKDKFERMKSGKKFYVAAFSTG